MGDHLSPGVLGYPRIHSRRHLQKQFQNNFFKQNKKPRGLKVWLRVPALQVQSPEIKPQTHQKKKEEGSWLTPIILAT
jgi:hypothetical protein